MFETPEFLWDIFRVQFSCLAGPQPPMVPLRHLVAAS